MSICRARLRNTSNALTFRMSGEQLRPQFPPKLFGVNSWIAQMIRQWIPDCWSGDRKCTSPKSAAANSRTELTVDDVWQIADALSFVSCIKQCNIYISILWSCSQRRSELLALSCRHSSTDLQRLSAVLLLQEMLLRGPCTDRLNSLVTCISVIINSCHVHLTPIVLVNSLLTVNAIHCSARSPAVEPTRYRRSWRD